MLRSVKVVVPLGRLAFDHYLSILKSQPVVISSYHPSQQNTSTGRLTEAMLVAVFPRARRMLAA